MAVPPCPARAVRPMRCLHAARGRDARVCSRSRARSSPRRTLRALARVEGLSLLLHKARCALRANARSTQGQTVALL
eukprot:6196919-Pleurochrysis_carterae.AAC.2